VALHRGQRVLRRPDSNRRRRPRSCSAPLVRAGSHRRRGCRTSGRESPPRRAPAATPAANTGSARTSTSSRMTPPARLDTAPAPLCQNRGMKRAMFLLLLGAAAPALAQTSTAPPPKIELAYTEFTLPNGLRVILHEDHSVPMATVNMWYHVGSA